MAAMSTFSDRDLDFFIENNLNVLFEGKHGVGKTHMILDAFKRNKLRFAYFSGSTLDPWVDFVGVPRPQIDEESGKVYLDLVRPKIFVLGNVEAIFVDEYNRSAKKVRNAIMELIQFGTINGYHMKSLRVIWAAINPPSDDDVTYDSDELDPAQRDRFQIHINVPYKPSPAFFKSKFGETTSRLGIAWWNELPKEMKNLVSPRRLEYALDLYVAGGDINFVLPSETNPQKLHDNLLDGPVLDKLIDIAEANDTTRAKLTLMKDVNIADCLLHNFGNLQDTVANFWLPMIPLDSIMSMVTADDAMLYYVVTHAVSIKPLAKIVTSTIRANDLSMEGWKVLFSLVSPINGGPSIAEQIKTNPYISYLTEVLRAAGFDHTVYLQTDIVPAMSGSLIGDADAPGVSSHNQFLELVAAFLNPPDYIVNMDKLKRPKPSGATLPSWYADIIFQIHKMRNHYHRTVLCNGVSIHNLIPLFVKAVIFDICNNGGVDYMEDIANYLPSNTVELSLEVIQAVSGKQFNHRISEAPQTSIKVATKGKLSKARKPRASKTKI